MQNHNIIPIAEAISGNVQLPAQEKRNRFRKNELLAGLSDEIYAQIAENIVVLSYGQGDVIFEENDPGDSLYLIAQGSVKISKKGRAGQQETLAYLMEL